MYIRMLALEVGPGVNRQSGKCYEVPDDEAKALLAGHYAVPVFRQGKAVPLNAETRAAVLPPDADQAPMTPQEEAPLEDGAQAQPVEEEETPQGNDKHGKRRR